MYEVWARARDKETDGAGETVRDLLLCFLTCCLLSDLCEGHHRNEALPGGELVHRGTDCDRSEDEDEGEESEDE